jgi:hypothetical protein
MQPSIKKFVNLGLTAIGIAMIAIALAAVGSRTSNAVPGPQHVLVVNGTAAPVPTAPVGTTQVAGTVSVSSIPNLQIGNTVLVRDTDNPARHPFEAAVDAAIPDTFGGNNATLTTVPAGKVLVVEHVSAVAFLPAGQKFSAGVYTDFARTHHLVSTARGSFGGEELFEISQPIRLYVGPGASLNVRVDRDVASGAGQARFTISGYLVDSL